MQPLPGFIEKIIQLYEMIVVRHGLMIVGDSFGITDNDGRIAFDAAKELIERCDFFQTWLDNGHPISFWLSGFFFTQAFTTAAKQNYARKYTIEIDMIDFDFFMKDNPGDTDERPEDGVLVYGMFLEGAKWDYEKHALAESDPKVLFTSFPPMLFLPEKTTNMHQFDKYEAPLYKTSERRGILSTTGHSTNFVCAVLVPSNMPESHWINRGTALLTSLDD
ncbi:hypothetical protein PPROV_001048800 [Pycnococcus provasolii]|uniref:Dynein heavy chain C-terminal domain-containing protein n=1 Tax=Pycnococcus provasolii TaxID=41880 RepID=A0A830I106_9CHLO|nr:hypothetical protein PPROV_001048800 [Pycnococcus provasolii]